MKALLVLTAAIEAGAGLGLLLAPSLVALILLGSPLDSGVGLTVARVAGAALLSICLVCWLGRGFEGSPALALVAGLLLYNVAATTILIFSAIGVGQSGIALWPAVLLHTVLAGWCVACLRSRPAN